MEEQVATVTTRDLVPNYIRCAVRPVVKATNDKDREILHLINTDSVDRAGDIVEPKGADHVNYSNNPVVLVDHDYRVEKIIGESVALSVDEHGLWSRTRFFDTPLARDAYSVASRHLGGWSIGFRPKKYDPIKDDKGVTRGYRFKEWELLEYSMVAIPMNQDAVNRAVHKGLVTPDHVPTFFTIEAPSTDVSQRSNAPTIAALPPAFTRSLTAINQRLTLATFAKELKEAERKISNG